MAPQRGSGSLWMPSLAMPRARLA